MIETKISKKRIGWAIIAIGVVVLIATALYINDVYNGQKNLAPLFKDGAEIAQGIQIPPEILNLIALLIYGILMFSASSKFWDLGFKLIKESKE